jgi:hypothetical protein
MEIRDEVNCWNLSVGDGTVVCVISTCLDCGSTDLVFYEVRDRVFLAVVAMMVIRLASYVVRFRCRRCGKRMTQWPPFAVPKMRYVKQTILELGGAYVEQPEATYRSLVEFIGYESEEGEIDERKPSTWMLWHCLNNLGEMDGILNWAKELILAKHPSDDLHRQGEPIPAKKYRSKAREGILRVARDLIRAEARFVELFGRSCLPKFETG